MGGFYIKIQISGFSVTIRGEDDSEPSLSHDSGYR